MNLNKAQRIVIANTLKEVLAKAEIEFGDILRAKAPEAQTLDQNTNYASFSLLYFRTLKRQAPDETKLVSFQHDGMRRISDLEDARDIYSHHDK